MLSSIGLPDARAQTLLASHGRLVDSLDIAVPDFVSVNVDDVVDLASRHPLWISKIDIIKQSGPWQAVRPYGELRCPAGGNRRGRGLHEQHARLGQREDGDTGAMGG